MVVASLKTIAKISNGTFHWYYFSVPIIHPCVAADNLWSQLNSLHLFLIFPETKSQNPRNLALTETTCFFSAF